jgi:hypothetical protein
VTGIRFFNSALKNAIVKVGDGRGFIVQNRRELPTSLARVRREIGERLAELNPGLKLSNPGFIYERFVVTAAHCLPHLPPAHAGAFYYERTYQLLGRLGDSQPKTRAECVFVDPVADIAVLSTPDTEQFDEDADAYHDLVTNDVRPLRIGKPPRRFRAWLLGLDGQWFSCAANSEYDRLKLGATPKNEPGISGSAIFAEDGSAIGVVVIGCESNGSHLESGPHPALANHLPGWLARRARIVGKDSYKMPLGARRSQS